MPERTRSPDTSQGAPSLLATRSCSSRLFVVGLLLLLVRPRLQPLPWDPVWSRQAVVRDFGVLLSSFGGGTGEYVGAMPDSQGKEQDGEG